MLPTTLEDIDSVNFALGVRDFDPAQHRPHPPGYPVYIALGKAATAATGALWPDGRDPTGSRRGPWPALSLVGALLLVWWTPSAVQRAVASTAAIGRGTAWRSSRAGAACATLLAATAPLSWYMSSRPMSDVPGLAAALAALVCLGLAWWRQRPGRRRRSPARSPAAMAASGRVIVLGALLAGFAVGFRSQTLLDHGCRCCCVVLVDRIGRGVAGALLGRAIAFAAGVARVGRAAAGGQRRTAEPTSPRSAARRARTSPASRCSISTRSPRLAAFALLRTFVWPWDSVPLAGGRAGAGGRSARWSCSRARAADRWPRWLRIARARISCSTCCSRTRPSCATRCRSCWPVAFLAAVAPRRARPRRRAVAAVGAGRLEPRGRACPQLAAYIERGSPTARLFDRATAAAATRRRRRSLAMHQALPRPLEAEPRPIGQRLRVAAAARVARAGALLARGARRRRCGSSPIRGEPISRSSIRRRGVDVESFDWDVSSLSPIGGMRPADVMWYRMRRARLVRRRGMGSHPRNRRHGAADGPRAAPGADHAWVAPPRRSGARCWSAAATSGPTAIRRAIHHGGRRRCRGDAGTSAPGFFVRGRRSARRRARRGAAGCAD